MGLEEQPSPGPASRASTVVCSPSASCWRTSSVGLALPCSMWDRCDAATPLLSASSAWLMPNSARRFLQLEPSVRANSDATRSEEHTSELQSLMRISYAVFCLKKKKTIHITPKNPKMLTRVLSRPITTKHHRV